MANITKRSRKKAEGAADILRLYTPMDFRKVHIPGYIDRPELDGKPLDQRSLWIDAFYKAIGDVHFLAGMLAVIPHVASPQRVPLRHEAERLLERAHGQIRNGEKLTASSKRKLREITRGVSTLKLKIDKAHRTSASHHNRLLNDVRAARTQK